MDEFKYFDNKDYLRLFSLNEIMQADYYKLFNKMSKNIIKLFNTNKNNFLEGFNKSFKKIENNLLDDISTKNILSILKLLIYPINNSNKLTSYSRYNINILYFNELILNNYTPDGIYTDDFYTIDSFVFDTKVKLKSFCILRTINGIKYKYDKNYQLTDMILVDGSEISVNN